MIQNGTNMWSFTKGLSANKAFDLLEKILEIHGVTNAVQATVI
jgi:hypothetical protein